MNHSTPDCALDTAPEQDKIPAWAQDNANDLLRFIFASPRPCEALDKVIALAA